MFYIFFLIFKMDYFNLKNDKLLRKLGMNKKLKINRYFFDYFKKKMKIV